MTSIQQPTKKSEETTEESGQATTSEEAMEAVAGVDGHVDESAYAPTGKEPTEAPDEDAGAE